MHSIKDLNLLALKLDFFSCSLNNPLKFTDQSGYNYMIDGMEVSERAFFNFWKNMSGTEMYIEMYGSWNNVSNVWFLQRTSYTETIAEESAFLTNSWYGYAPVTGEFGFFATTSGSRTNIWAGSLGSASIVNYGGKPDYSFLMGDDLIGLFSLKTITEGCKVSIADLQRGMRMSGEVENKKNRELYFKTGGNISIGIQLGSGVSINNVNFKVAGNLLSIDLFQYEAIQTGSHQTDWVHDFNYIGKQKRLKMRQNISTPLIGYYHSFSTEGEGYVPGSREQSMSVLSILKANDKGDRGIRIGYNAAFILGIDFYFEFGSKEK